MRKRHGAKATILRVSPHSLARLDARRGMWHETEQEVAERLTWDSRKKALIRWVRLQMRRRLTSRERRCVELYYFKGMTYQEVGDATETNPSSAHRAVRRSLRKLRQAAEEDPSWEKLMRRRRRGR